MAQGSKQISEKESDDKCTKHEKKEKLAVDGFVREYEAEYNIEGIKKTPIALIQMILKYKLIKYNFMLIEKIEVNDKQRLICFCGKKMKKREIYSNINNDEIPEYQCDICSKIMTVTTENEEYQLWNCNSNSSQSKDVHGADVHPITNKDVSLGFDICRECGEKFFEIQK